MDVQIKEVTTLKDLKAFIHFPFTLYRNNPYWVPTLISDDLNTLRRDKNPAFETCQARYWLAYRDGAIVGRVAAILNRPHIEKWGQHYMRFGWLDFIDDPQVSTALLEAVEAWAKEDRHDRRPRTAGLHRHGPGRHARGRLRRTRQPWRPIYNHPYYPAHMERLGYAKDTDWVEYEISMPAEPDEKIARMAAIVAMRRNKFKLLEIRNKKELLKYAKNCSDCSKMNTSTCTASSR